VTDTPEQVLARLDADVASLQPGWDDEVIISRRRDLQRALESVARESYRLSEDRSRWGEMRDRLLAWFMSRQSRVGTPRAPMTPICTGLDEVAIYALVDPIAPTEVRYIGLSATPFHRYRAHVKSMAWAKELVAQGRMPVMLLVEWTPHPDIARLREAHWIGHFRAMGMADLNVSLAGVTMEAA